MTLILPISVLWHYKEFDRATNPSPLGINSVAKMMADIQREGMRKPIELTVWNNSALVTDGNHRLAAMKKLGYKYISTKIQFFATDFSTGTDYVLDTWPVTTIARFVRVGKDIANTLNSIR